MRLPFDKARLAERNALDALDGQRRAPQDPASGLAETLDLSEAVRQLAQATGSLSHGGSLQEKARLFVRPLLALVGK